MKVIRCNHGHWYDADTYAQCPHCNPSSGKIKSVSDASRSNVQPPVAEENTPNKVDISARNRGQFVDPVADSVSDLPPQEMPLKKPKKTFSAFSQNGDSTFDGQGELTENAPIEEPSSETIPEAPTDLKKELQGVSNSSVQKTMSYFGKVSQSLCSPDSSHSSQQSMSAAPVVGWLVCIAGPHIGQSFNITAGKNSIGRGPDNDIVLSNDPTVSGSKHAWVTYEAKHRNFILQAGDGRYPDLNGEQVIEGKMLKAFDKIELGNTLLLFVNLCGDIFAWEDYLNKE